MKAALEIQDLSKRFRQFSLTDISLELPAGYIMGFVGPNGAGKSTTIKCIMNLLHPDSGSIHIYGKDHRRDEMEIKRIVGYVGEEQPFYEELSVEQTIGFVKGFYENWDDSLCKRLMAKYELIPGKKVKDLSKGTRAKLALTIALAHRPKLLILDEPMSGLDPIVRHEVLKELLEVIQDESRAVFFSTHLLEDISKVADYVALINGGRLLFSAEKDEITLDWKRLLLPAEFLPEVKAYIRAWKGEGGQVIAITDAYRKLREENPKIFQKPNVQVDPIDLDGILMATVKGEVV